MEKKQKNTDDTRNAGMHSNDAGGRLKAASERRGNDLKWVKDFYLRAKARHWP